MNLYLVTAKRSYPIGSLIAFMLCAGIMIFCIVYRADAPGYSTTTEEDMIMDLYNPYLRPFQLDLITPKDNKHKSNKGELM